MNTSLEAFAVGTPVVTMPTALQRGRHTFGMYTRMGIDSCIARDAAHYVSIALELGTDRATVIALAARSWRTTTVSLKTHGGSGVRTLFPRDDPGLNSVPADQSLPWHRRTVAADSAYLVLVGIYLLPIWWFPYFPTQDGPAPYRQCVLVKELRRSAANRRVFYH